MIIWDSVVLAVDGYVVGAGIGAIIHSVTVTSGGSAGTATVKQGSGGASRAVVGSPANATDQAVFDINVPDAYVDLGGGAASVTVLFARS
jgi:hypothetical protein